MFECQGYLQSRIEIGKMKTDYPRAVRAPSMS